MENMSKPYEYLVKIGIDSYYKCPVCELKLKAEYPSKTIFGDWKHNAQLSMSNFNRHLKKCKMSIELEELKQKIREYKDYYGWKIIYQEDIENATTREQLAEIIDRYRNYLEDCLNDAQNGLKRLKHTLDLHNLD